ncbi:hypothetical protein GCM10011521_13060 [Arenimonas soli]|uniref:Uncharacterized protein n=1 Tax=Arenimonas soli TaxID=2269504 RepID=A0ABQ1HHD8_9GAMM|nr:hypothetical protein [Arenimonas soli]GGA76241.1 hypothetical protein GCM10011521_13060 [Arenimonas soli]
MDDHSDSPRISAQASDGGFRPRSAVGGFLLSLKSLLWPLEAGSAPVPQRAPDEPPARSLRQLRAMPKAPGTDRPVPLASPSGEDPHPLRRVAGSAGRWKKRLAEARETWPRATVAELIATDGHARRLAGLIQERYGLAPEAAEQQVTRFLGAHDGRPPPNQEQAP